MREAVIVEALRTPIARGRAIKGDLSGIHAGKLLAEVQTAVIERAGVEPEDVEQIIGGCVGGQVVDEQLQEWNLVSGWWR